MARSKHKGLYFDPAIFEGEWETLPGVNRDMHVLPIFKNKEIRAYDGRKWYTVRIYKKRMFKKKIGDFIFTKKKCINMKKKKKEQQAKKVKSKK